MRTEPIAIYHLRAKIISRSKGQSTVAGAAYRSGGHSATHAAAYRSGERLTDERTGRTFDYGRKQGIVHTEILASESAPAWVYDRAQLWNTVERAEKRKDAQLAREIEISLPRELSHGQQVELVRSFVKEQFVNLSMVADIALHCPKATDGKDQPHAHIMLTLRPWKPDTSGFGNKERDWNKPELLGHWREQWALFVNQAWPIPVIPPGLITAPWKRRGSPVRRFPIYRFRWSPENSGRCPPNSPDAEISGTPSASASWPCRYWVPYAAAIWFPGVMRAALEEEAARSPAYSGGGNYVPQR